MHLCFDGTDLAKTCGPTGNSNAPEMNRARLYEREVLGWGEQCVLSGQSDQGSGSGLELAVDPLVLVRVHPGRAVDLRRCQRLSPVDDAARVRRAGTQRVARLRSVSLAFRGFHIG